MQESSRPEAVRGPAPAPPRPKSLRPVAGVVLVALVVLLALSIVMERRTPSSPQAVVQAYLVPMAAEVPGRVSEVAVADNARVRAGEVLFRVDPQPYRIAVEEAEARLERIGQGVGASMSAIEAAQSRVVDARANRENVRQQAGRVMQLVQRGV
jgi:multidrug resistance efflux pump